jgi:hypothetical protein
MEMALTGLQAEKPTPLAATIIESGLKKKHIVARTGIGRDRLRMLENGAEPRLSESTALAQILGKPVQELFPEHTTIN